MINPSRSSVGGSETGSGREGSAKQNQNEQVDNKNRGDFSHLWVVICDSVIYDVISVLIDVYEHK